MWPLSSPSFRTTDPSWLDYIPSLADKQLKKALDPKDRDTVEV